jgi:hypothetical protein
MRQVNKLVESSQIKGFMICKVCATEEVFDKIGDKNSSFRQAIIENIKKNME